MTPTLCLNAIVKDEAGNLPRFLTSVVPYISCAVIADTGSSDNTVRLLIDFFDGQGIPFHVGEIPFENFAQARNDALDLAFKSGFPFNYLLFGDADMELVARVPSWHAELRAPAYDLKQEAGGLTFWNTRLLRADQTARYKGYTHEVLTGVRATRLEAAWYRDHCSGSNRPQKFARDSHLLQQAIKDDPTDARSVYYLAQTLRDGGDVYGAVAAFKKRSEMGGWDEEAWHAFYNYARGLAALGDTEGFIRNSLAAYNARPTRAEPLFYLARYYERQGMLSLARMVAEHGQKIPYPSHQTDVLFIEDRVYHTPWLRDS